MGVVVRNAPLDSRYEGRPFLKLLDSYVLRGAGELEPEDELLLGQMTPKLQEVYASQGGALQGDIGAHHIEMLRRGSATRSPKQRGQQRAPTRSWRHGSGGSHADSARRSRSSLTP